MYHQIFVDILWPHRFCNLSLILSFRSSNGTLIGIVIVQKSIYCPSGCPILSFPNLETSPKSYIMYQNRIIGAQSFVLLVRTLEFVFLAIQSIFRSLLQHQKFKSININYSWVHFCFHRWEYVACIILIFQNVSEFGDIVFALTFHRFHGCSPKSLSAVTSCSFTVDDW